LLNENVTSSPGCFTLDRTAAAWPFFAKDRLVSMCVPDVTFLAGRP
jgi:hypothetical protein